MQLRLPEHGKITVHACMAINKLHVRALEWQTGERLRHNMLQQVNALPYRNWEQLFEVRREGNEFVTAKNVTCQVCEVDTRRMEDAQEWLLPKDAKDTVIEAVVVTSAKCVQQTRTTL